MLSGDAEHGEVQLHGEPADQLPLLLDQTHPLPAHEGKHKYSTKGLTVGHTRLGHICEVG